MPRHPLRKAIASLIFTFLTVSLIAGELDYLSEDDFYNELPVVLHATRLSQPLNETPASITVIDQQFIRRSTASTIPELLRFVPGFQVAYASGNEITASYHGVSDQHARRMQVLVDGRSIYNQAFGGVLWSTLPISIEDVEKIEVIRGPNAAAYGANAFFGVINIVTKNPAEYPGTSLRLDIGSNNWLRTNLRHAGSVGDIDYSISALLQQNDGIDNRHDGIKAGHFNSKLNWRVNATDSVDFGIGYRNVDEQQGFSGDPIQPLREREFDSSYQQVRWRRVNATDDETQVSFYHNQISSRDSFYPLLASEFFGAPPPLIKFLTGHPDDAVGVNQDFKVDRFDLELQRILRLNEDLRIVWGGGFRHDTVSAPGFIDNSAATRDQWRLFANAEWYLAPSLLMNLGAMYEDHENIGGFTSPRLGLNYRVNDQHSLRTSVSRAYRMPSFFEHDTNYALQWGDGSGVVEVEALGLPAYLRYDSNAPGPEKIDAREVGYFGQFLEDRLTIDLKVFNNEISDLIDSSLASGLDYFGETLVYHNNYAITHRGVEAQIQYLDEKNHFMLGYSYVDANESLPDAYHASTPRHTLSLFYTRRLTDSLFASLAAFHLDKMRWQGEGDEPDAATWADLKLEKTFKTSMGNAGVALAVHNLFDHDYVFFRNENTGERSYLLTFRYQF